ncbi:DUF1361 domain-containing protein [Flavobacterium silvaticum]|uniref:DUF1361 domain-containing protein n=1 Tax=Flavobacterium silvaticum TaxID=1852020 RepID=A0A972FXE3_9FLAO|nr:DUF1361 domain-containing protein [Flavobacterium silvaticum]NMH29390.1 DUF1361 domain-containing protein [Flavobacterium silvaticum]
MTHHYAFLIWNLFLAWVPIVIVNYLINRRNIKGIKLILTFITWLLFLPNAPYLITDLLHFRHTANMTAWFDVLLLSAFAISGLLFGLVALFRMQQILNSRIGKKQADILIFFSAVLSGFGIYLGRFERYNSWDVISNPFSLAFDIIRLCITARSVGVTLGFGLLFYLAYFFIKSHFKSNTYGNTHSNTGI